MKKLYYTNLCELNISALKYKSNINKLWQNINNTSDKFSILHSHILGIKLLILQIW